MSLCVLYMLFCACAFMLNSQWAHADSREIPGHAPMTGKKTTSELLIQKTAENSLLLKKKKPFISNVTVSSDAHVCSDPQHRLW